MSRRDCLVPATKRRSNSFIARLWRDKPLGALGGVVLLLFLVVGIFADPGSPYDYNEIAPLDRMQGPSWAHWFGTDNLGRDMLSRCIYGAQLSVIIGCSAAALATLISGLIGIISGYFGGKVDMVMQRVVDAWMSFPDLIVLIVVVSACSARACRRSSSRWAAAGHRRLAHRALGGGVGARAHVCACRAVDRRLGAHPVAPCAAQCAAAHHRAVHHPRGHGDPGRIGPVLPGPGRAAAGTHLGLDAVGQRPHLHVPGPLAGAGAGPVPDGVVYATNVFGDALRDLLDPRMRGTR
jgi:peptide/nickel transport system permease protein